MKKVVIIGNGVAGITAARYIRKRTDWPITIISDETDYFYSRPALMYVFMGHMRFEHIKPYEDTFWKKNSISLVRGRVEHIDTAQKKVRLTDRDEIVFDALVLATGSVNRSFGMPGEDLDGVQGFNALQDVHRLENVISDTQHAVVVAGGLTGIEFVEMIHSRGISVTCLVRNSDYFRRVLPLEESLMISRHIKKHGIDLRLSTQLKEIIADDRGRVSSIITDAGDTIACQVLGVCIGVMSNIELTTASGITGNKGVLVNEFLETSEPDIYAAGDCAEIDLGNGARPFVEQLWYAARAQGEVVAQNICGEKTAYAPGVFYNSAKFFDIEYQVYGSVNKNIEREENVYWEHPDGTKSIRIVHVDGKVIGFNLMGIRYRSEVCRRWITEARDLNYVLAHLKDANFDPEFFTQYEKAVQVAGKRG